MYTPTKEFALPTETRISMTGHLDPLAKPKDADMQAIRVALAAHLATTQQHVLAGIRQVAGQHKAALPDDLQPFLAYFDDQFWADDTAVLQAALRPLFQDGVLHAAEGTYSDLFMASGISLDQTAFAIDAAQAARDWTDQWLASLGTTNQRGVGAVLQRWIGTPGATMPDLVRAIQASHLFSRTRAEAVAETEVTRAYAIGTYNVAEDYAQQAGLDLAVAPAAYTDLLPAHVRCRCWVTPQFVYGDGYQIVKVVLIWHTANDDTVCGICGPRNGKDVSTL